MERPSYWEPFSKQPLLVLIDAPIHTYLACEGNPIAGHQNYSHLVSTYTDSTASQQPATGPPVAIRHTHIMLFQPTSIVLAS